MKNSQFTFTNTPVIKRPRSRFDLSSSVLTSLNVGKLAPFYVQEVYPGDTMKINAGCVTRLSSSFFKPILDNLFLDVYWFFVPSRILYKDFPCIFGENTSSPWANSGDFVCPHIGQFTTANANVVKGSVGDYLGLPLTDNANAGTLRGVNILPFRAFAKIYDDWFRDQNNIDPMHIQIGDQVGSEVPNASAWSPNNYMGLLPNVAKMHDYFTSCLPQPQKSVSGVAAFPGGVFPVTTSSDVTTPQTDPMHLVDVTEPSISFTGILGAIDGNLVNVNGSANPGGNLLFAPDNLVADASNIPFTVNDLRYAFQLQKMLERDARGGTRYCEYLASHWGVSSGDARLQRSEFLGGRRSPISITQVTQTSAQTGNSTTLADVAAFSASYSKTRATKGFVEHGYLLGVCCIRQFHSYSQGIAKFWKRKERTDFYEPVFANIGEQPVYASELYSLAKPDQVFGYNEAWADLRYRPNLVTGQMRPLAKDSLALWHLGDNYASAPVLGKEFIEETPAYVDRAISVTSSSQDQFILDFYVENIAYRELPTYSVPSLIDHN